SSSTSAAGVSTRSTGSPNRSISSGGVVVGMLAVITPSSSRVVRGSSATHQLTVAHLCGNCLQTLQVRREVRCVAERLHESNRRHRPSVPRYLPAAIVHPV